MTDTPRLVDVHAASAHLSVSVPTLRGLVRDGEIVPVRLPSSRRPGDVSRRLLFDVRDLDAVVDRWKNASTSEPNAALSQAALKGWQQSPVRKRKAS